MVGSILILNFQLAKSPSPRDLGGAGVSQGVTSKSSKPPFIFYIWLLQIFFLLIQSHPCSPLPLTVGQVRACPITFLWCNNCIFTLTSSTSTPPKRTKRLFIFFFFVVFLVGQELGKRLFLLEMIEIGGIGNSQEVSLVISKANENILKRNGSPIRIPLFKANSRKDSFLLPRSNFV